MPDTISLSLDEVHALALQVLTHHGLSQAHASAITRVIVAGERDECHSHGVFRLLMCTRSLREGKVSRHAEPMVSQRSAAVVAVDAQFGFSPLAFEVGSQHLVEKVRRTSIAALVINNCFHFSALWPEVESLAAHQICALAMTPAHACVAPAGGRLSVFGTNPIAFSSRPSPARAQGFRRNAALRRARAAPRTACEFRARYTRTSWRCCRKAMPGSSFLQHHRSIHELEKSHHRDWRPRRG